MKAQISEAAGTSQSRKWKGLISRIKGLFEHMEDFPIKEKNVKLITDEDGRVITQERNFYTTGAKRGGGGTVPG